MVKFVKLEFKEEQDISGGALILKEIKQEADTVGIECFIVSKTPSEVEVEVYYQTEEELKEFFDGLLDHTCVTLISECNPRKVDN